LIRLFIASHIIITSRHHPFSSSTCGRLSSWYHHHIHTRRVKLPPLTTSVNVNDVSPTPSTDTDVDRHWQRQ